MGDKKTRKLGTRGRARDKTLNATVHASDGGRGGVEDGGGMLWAVTCLICSSETQCRATIKRLEGKVGFKSLNLKRKVERVSGHGDRMKRRREGEEDICYISTILYCEAHFQIWERNRNV